jgi:hypothetical protein
MTAALEGGEWSAARPDRTLPPGKNRYPFYRRLGGPQGRSGRTENLVPTGIRSRTVQPVVSRCTDWATRPTYSYVVTSIVHRVNILSFTPWSSKLPLPSIISSRKVYTFPTSLQALLFVSLYLWISGFLFWSLHKSNVIPTLESSSNLVQKLSLFFRTLEVPHSNPRPVTWYPEASILHRHYIYLPVWNLKL